MNEDRVIVFSSSDEIAYYRAGLIKGFEDEASKRGVLVRKFVDQFLTLYNSGACLQGTYKKLGSVSRRTFYRWIKTFNQGGVETLIPQSGKKGMSKITEHEKNILLTLLLHANRLKIAYGITLAKEYLKKRGHESPSSPATLRRFIDQFKKEHYDIWVLRREGEKALNDKVVPYAERDWRLLEVGEGLVADGHRLNFQVVHPVTGKPCRAALVLFWDWRSSYPLGWEIMLEESIQCVASALRNAIITLGKIPKWVYLDNGKAFKARLFTEDVSLEDTGLPGMFARLNINYHFAQPYNAQSKPIERMFGIMNEQFERLVPSYTGGSIADKPAWTKRNEKYARSLHDPFVPRIPEANDLIRAWRDRYAEQPTRGRDGLRPIDIFSEGRGPGVDPARLIYLMMHGESKQVHRNGVTWLGWHWHDEAMYGLKDKVVIRYSLSDLSQIYVFHKNEFLCTARPVEQVHPMASESENPKDMEAVKEVNRLKKKVKNSTLKASDLLESEAASQVDWSRIKQPQIREAIQKIQETKRPKVVMPSPWRSEAENTEGGGNETTFKQPDEYAIIVYPDHPLSCPEGPPYESEWERYEWLRKVEIKLPGRLQDGDWCRIEDYEGTYEWERYYAWPREGVSNYTSEETYQNLQCIFGRSLDINERPRLKRWLESDYQKYLSIIRQDSFNQEQRKFIRDFRKTSPLYKSVRNFNDEDELDRKVVFEGEAAKESVENRASDD